MKKGEMLVDKSLIKDDDEVEDDISYGTHSTISNFRDSMDVSKNARRKAMDDLAFRTKGRFELNDIYKDSYNKSKKNFNEIDNKRNDFLKSKGIPPRKKD